MRAPKVSLKKIEQVIDLNEFFPDVDFSQERALKEAIGQAIIDRIASRTEDGEGMSFGAGGQGRPVSLKSPYSKEYANSLEFKAAGKKRTKVNMTLTGDMLASVDLEPGDDGKVTIYIPDDEVPKAFNHITGDTVPRRPWFGVNKSEVKDILDKFKADIQDLSSGELDKENSKKLSALDAINANFDLDEGD
jgi:hypothetical protein